MNISHKNIDDINIHIQVELAPEDYNPKVDKAIKDQAKKAKLPGFRPGLVPSSHIRRLYGKSILFDEINRTVNDEIAKYISEKELEVLGQPLPVESEKDKDFNWDYKDNFEFTYEVGLSPEFEIPFTKDSEFIEYDIQVDANTLSERVKNLRRSYGKMSNPEVSEDGDVLYATLKQDKEEGIEKTASVRLDFVKDAKIKKSLIGLKKDDSVKLDVKKAFEAKDTAFLLGITEEEAEALDVTKFELTVQNVNRLEEAELNEEFFNKLFPEGDVKTEEEFSAKVEEEIKGMLVQNSVQKVRNDMYTFGMEKIQAQFPEDFLKRWLQATNPEIKPEELEEGFPEFLDNLKWTILENRILKQNEIEVGYDDVMNLAKEKIKDQIRMYNIQDEPAEEELTQYAMQLLQDREQSNRVFEEAKALKVFDFLKGLVKFKSKKIDYDKFLKLEEKK